MHFMHRGTSITRLGATSKGSRGCTVCPYYLPNQALTVSLNQEKKRSKDGLTTHTRTQHPASRFGPLPTATARRPSVRHAGNAMPKRGCAKPRPLLRRLRTVGLPKWASSHPGWVRAADGASRESGNGHDYAVPPDPVHRPCPCAGFGALDPYRGTSGFVASLPPSPGSKLRRVSPTASAEILPPILILDHHDSEQRYSVSFV
jgi:hypothetical protein